MVVLLILGLIVYAGVRRVLHLDLNRRLFLLLLLMSQDLMLS